MTPCFVVVLDDADHLISSTTAASKVVEQGRSAGEFTDEEQPHRGSDLPQNERLPGRASREYDHREKCDCVKRKIRMRKPGRSGRRGDHRDQDAAPNCNPWPEGGQCRAAETVADGDREAPKRRLQGSREH